MSGKEIQPRARLGWCPRRKGLVVISPEGCSGNCTKNCVYQFKTAKGIGAVQIKIPKKMTPR